MLAWPAFALLKAQYPDCSITALVPAYTQPMAALCPWIDDVIIDDNKAAVLSGARTLARRIKAHQFDASISFYSEARTALALWLAKVPERYGPATKIAQIFLNKKLRQRRSSSSKPEHEYNTDLSRFYIESQGNSAADTPSAPYLIFSDNQTRVIRERFTAEHNIAATKQLIIIHPGSGGSAINLPLEQFAELARSIAIAHNVYFIITAGPSEISTAKTLEKLINLTDCCTYYSQEGLAEFSKFINICDLFISGSTGPLHIAGALDVPTVAFYPARRSATALRWQTLNSPDKRAALTLSESDSPDSQPYVDLSICAKEVTRLLEKHSKKRP